MLGVTVYIVEGPCIVLTVPAIGRVIGIRITIGFSCIARCEYGVAADAARFIRIGVDPKVVDVPIEVICSVGGGVGERPRRSIVCLAVINIVPIELCCE